MEAVDLPARGFVRIWFLVIVGLVTLLDSQRITVVIEAVQLPSQATLTSRPERTGNGAVRKLKVTVLPARIRIFRAGLIV